MKFWQRLLSLLSACVLLSTVFSVNAKATDIESKDFHVLIGTYANSDSVNEYNELLVYPNNETDEKIEYVYENGIPTGSKFFETGNFFGIKYDDGTALLKKGRKSKITLNNAYISMLLTRGTNQRYHRAIDSVQFLVTYTDGSNEYIDGVYHEQPSTALNNFSIEFTPKADVKRVDFIAYSKYTYNSPTTVDVKVTVYAGEFSSDDMNLAITIQSEEAGLLTGIIEWLTSIRDGITGFMDSFANFVIELPNTIINAIKSAFIPDSEVIEGFKNDIDTLLEDRLGAVYQVANLTFDSFEAIRNYDIQNTIEFPSVTINLLNGDTFTFGGYDVAIVPQRMEFAAGMLKVIIGIVCTFMFVNGLRKRYDEVMGVEQ